MVPMHVNKALMTKVAGLNEQQLTPFGIKV
jgi:hypothetical protein